MDDFITLISVQTQINSIGVYEETETETEVFASVSSVNRAEWFNGGANGLNPELVFTTDVSNYNGEKTVVFRGVRYAIYRTYFRNGGDEIELYAERKTGA